MLVTALDVCAALLEPRRALDPGVLPGAASGGPTDNCSPLPPGTSGSSSSSHAAAEAINSMLEYLPQLMRHLRDPSADSSSAVSSSAPQSSSDKGHEKDGAGASSSASAAAAKDGDGPDAPGEGSSETGEQSSSSSSSSADSITVRQETPYGVLEPPLGRARLRIVELLAVLLRVGDDAVDAALIQAESLQIVQELFVAYPFNNLLHHQMYALLLAVLRRASPVMVSHMFGDCQLITWLLTLPQEVTPIPRPGRTNKIALRAGYLGHVTRIGQVLQEAAAQQQEIADVLQATPSWPELLQQLAPRFELEDVSRWQCGRPANTDGNELDSDGDEFPVSD